MDCNKFREHIDGFIDNSISNGLTAKMLTHARKCPECKKELEDMQKIVECMNSLPAISVPDDFLAKLNERIDSEELLLKTQSQDKYKKIFNYRTYSALAACILLFAIVKADIPNMLGRSSGTEQSIVSVIPENETKNITKSTTDEVISDTPVHEVDESTPIPTSVPERKTSPATTPASTQDKALSKQTSKVTPVPAKITMQDTNIAIVTPQPTSNIEAAPAITPVAPSKASGSSNTEALNAEKVTTTPVAKPTPASPATASTLSLTDKTSEEVQTTETEEQASRTSGSKGGGGGASSGGGYIPGNASSGSAGGGASISGAASSSSSAAVVKSTSYTVIVHCSDTKTVLSLLSKVGYTAKGGSYSISSANADKLFTILDSNGISYTKSKKDTSDNVTDIYLIVE